MKLWPDDVSISYVVSDTLRLEVVRLNFSDKYVFKKLRLFVFLNKTSINCSF